MDDFIKNVFFDQRDKVVHLLTHELKLTKVLLGWFLQTLDLLNKKDLRGTQAVKTLSIRALDSAWLVLSLG